MKLILLGFLLIFLNINSANAGLLLPWNPVVKANMGLDFARPSISGLKMQNQDFGKDVAKFKNLNIYAGLRILRYIGIEAGYSKLGGDFSKEEISYNSTIKNTYIDAKIFFPIMSIGVSSVDGYFSLGIANIDASATKISDKIKQDSPVKTATKIGAGIEADIVNSVSFRLGWYTIDKRLEMFDFGRLNVVYGGFSIYLI